MKFLLLEIRKEKENLEIASVSSRTHAETLAMQAIPIAKCYLPYTVLRIEMILESYAKVYFNWK